MDTIPGPIRFTITNANHRLAEEVKDASNTLPRAILWGVGLNTLLGYIVVITLCFTMTDTTALLNSPTGFPFIQLFYNVTNSYVGTDIMAAIIVINLVSAVISEIATASRQIWSFARDDGFPFSNFLKKVSLTLSNVRKLLRSTFPTVGKMTPPSPA